MVTSAREEAAKDHEEMQRKNEQLKAQLSDTKILLSSQEEQLAGLKLIMEQMAEELQKQKDQMAEQQKKLDEHQKQMAMDREELIETKEQVGAQKEMLQKGEAVLKEHKEALTEMKSGCAGEISDLKDECEAVRKKLVISEEALSRRGSLQDMASASASTRASVEIGVQTPPAMEGDSSKAEQERHSEVPEIKVEDGEQVSPTASPKAAPASEPASESAKAQEEAQEAKADTKREPEPKLEVKPQMQMQ